MGTPLEAFPIELLGNIANQAEPSTIVNLALSCKTVHAAATKALVLHHNRKVLYTNLEIKIFPRYILSAHPIDLLHRICQDRRVATYPKSLDVKYFRASEIAQGRKFANGALDG